MSFPCCCAVCYKNIEVDWFFGYLSPAQCSVCGRPVCEDCVQGAEKISLCPHHTSPDRKTSHVNRIEQADNIREKMDEKVFKGEWPIVEMRCLVTLGFPIPDNVLESLIAQAVEGRRLTRGIALPLVVEFLSEYLKSEKWRPKIRGLLERARDHVELWSPNKEDQVYYWVAAYSLRKFGKLLEETSK